MNLAASLAQRIAQQAVQRGWCWAESFAVGSQGLVEKVRPLIVSRRKTQFTELSGNDVWILQETAIPYGQKTAMKNGPKGSCINKVRVLGVNQTNPAATAQAASIEVAGGGPS